MCPCGLQPQLKLFWRGQGTDVLPGSLRNDVAAFMNGASSGNDSDGDWQPTMSAATAVADRADRTAVQGQVGLVSMMSMDEEEQSAEAKQCLKALKEGKRCGSAAVRLGATRDMIGGRASQSTTCGAMEMWGTGLYIPLHRCTVVMRPSIVPPIQRWEGLASDPVYRSSVTCKSSPSVDHHIQPGGAPRAGC